MEIYLARNFFSIGITFVLLIGIEKINGCDFNHCRRRRRQ